MRISEMLTSGAATQLIMLTPAMLAEYSNDLINKVLAMKDTPQESGKNLYTAKEVREMLQVDASTLWRWAKCGYLPTTKVGNKVFYSKEDLLKVTGGKKNG